LYKPLQSVDIETKEPFEASIERSDSCAVPAAAVVMEHVVAFECARAITEQFSSDQFPLLQQAVSEYRKNITCRYIHHLVVQSMSFGHLIHIDEYIRFHLKHYSKKSYSSVKAVTDENVSNLYLTDVLTNIVHEKVYQAIIPQGETSKSNP